MPTTQISQDSEADTVKKSLYIEYGDETYRIRAGHHYGPDAEYGDPATLQITTGHKTTCYVACVHQTDDGERISLLGEHWVLQGRWRKPRFSEYDENAPG